ncbi:tRNA (N6-threonylcarbamoyladenosine(37)-N6)-methyltransferase TrmO [Spiribacter sp. C176]|uniref:tRNA (N6-threonylcarbamoyladenosine(37)-N6)-methyltransferase TrmO n=1 Tax=Spiribacter salilacus TaxID=2664894 RepID=A0A6N7QMQ7_9GAMM|nr:tRNA (N6-threonylcarbamoyladenosine(37)-N6)-methyltransferase TrmO [Spiribacter salilacus]MRH77322.1 tRNA (N6-threonylcarbamoyladenosine(37)-N6)-methyltransferase TrmO [Spiribacter salilacus]
MEIKPIATLQSVFTSRFGTPRQPGIVPDAEAVLTFLPPYNDPDALRGLETASHIWVIFGFHAIKTEPWRPMVRPPRLGGNRRLGVFSTRSPFRPNGLGLSVLRLLEVLDQPPVGLKLGGVDLMDGTPIYDVKPYLPEIDSLPDAIPPLGFEQPSEKLSVIWAPGLESTIAPKLSQLIAQTVAADPRPAYHRQRPDQQYGMTLAGHEVQWRVKHTQAEITAVTPL